MPVLDDDATVPLPAATAAERAKLAAVFSADGARERARGLRGLLVSAMALLGLPLWAGEVWPGRLPHDLRLFAVAAFATCALAAVASLAWEWRWRRARSSRIADL